MNRIRGKTAIVTGATAGIGEACARAFAEMGTDQRSGTVINKVGG